MPEMTILGGLSINQQMLNFVNTELLAGSSIEPDKFWEGFDRAVHELAPINRELLAIRADLQAKIDAWHRENSGGAIDQDAYEAFLKDIGYLVEEGPAFTIQTENVDVEIAKIAGPQLVVPITNARYALNAANARFGSLYDALYGTDVISEDDGAARKGPYNPVRGAKVIAYVRAVLDDAVPLENGSWANVHQLMVENGTLRIASDSEKTGEASTSKESKKSGGLANLAQFSGYIGDPANPSSIILNNNGLHFQIVINREGVIGALDPAGINDVIGESALSSIMDCEDSVATVDAEDKILAYHNWAGLMRGDLVDEFEKNGRIVTRKLASDIAYIAADGSPASLHGRAVMLVRNVGHLMTNPAILLADGSEIPEGIMDAFMTVAGALNDLTAKRNSRTGSIYIVKPKMHGPDEVKFTDKIFTAVETLLGLAPNTIKIGIMDEERRTTINLKECIRAAQHRVVFINTGFLDRTGDEMHTSMEAGPMIRKGDMKAATWIDAYENWNVDVGLECGLAGRAQIGKGMWAMPDLMAAMMTQKIDHPKSGANCAWVPSPTAATLHALHYHKVNVAKVQARIAKRPHAERRDILSIPTATRPNWSKDDILAELHNNAQGILGYVVRWVDQGVGCSKVPDIHGVGLMEDRATLRISSQHIANWLHHGVCTSDTVMSVMQEMASVVDQQNADDPTYEAMVPDFDQSIAFQAACDLVFAGKTQPSGYTEPILHARRLEKKAANGV